MTRERCSCEDLRSVRLLTTQGLIELAYLARFLLREAPMVALKHSGHEIQEGGGSTNL